MDEFNDADVERIDLVDDFQPHRKRRRLIRVPVDPPRCRMSLYPQLLSRDEWEKMLKERQRSRREEQRRQKKQKLDWWTVLESCYIEGRRYPAFARRS